MTRKTKLAELGLEKEAKELHDEEGYSYETTADTLNERHQDLILNTQGEPLSHMAVKRGIIAYEKSLSMKAIDDGDIIDTIERQFRETIRKINKKVNGLINKANEILNNAMTDGTITEQTRALKEVRDSLAQVVKNEVALQQYGFRQVANMNENYQKKEQKINVLIMNLSDELMDIEKHLCDKCKDEYLKRVESLITRIVNS